MASFSERLKELREEAGLNQKQLAEAIGVRNNTISRWELGGNMPKDQYSMQLAAFFRVSVPYLIGASDDRNVIMTEEEEDQIDNVTTDFIISGAQVRKDCMGFKAVRLQE